MFTGIQTLGVCADKKKSYANTSSSYLAKLHDVNYRGLVWKRGNTFYKGSVGSIFR